MLGGPVDSLYDPGACYSLTSEKHGKRWDGARCLCETWFFLVNCPPVIAYHWTRLSASFCIIAPSRVTNPVSGKRCMRMRTFHFAGDHTAIAFALQHRVQYIVNGCTSPPTVGFYFPYTGSVSRCRSVHVAVAFTLPAITLP
ncbi:hypothetical protein M513_02297 [Trichuris suis]|uniref:Uncharacterized protein n=1 Tax=Trichuris suis TaxID=68888 RepID=A0A085MHC5_9BILA|nr:hypothetical protein M513_02297 [Trichuris suis]